MMSPEEWKERVGQHVQLRRMGRGFPSVRAAADPMPDLSEGAWRPVETGRQGNGEVANPTLATQHAIARRLRWPLDFVQRLLSGEDPKDFPDTPESLEPASDRDLSLEALVGWVRSLERVMDARVTDLEDRLQTVEVVADNSTQLLDQLGRTLAAVDDRIDVTDLPDEGGVVGFNARKADG